jgi:DnaK suppressor protein
MSTHDAVRAQLQERLDRLLRRVGSIEGDLRQSHDRDWVERASELENEEVLEGLDDMSRTEIRQIRAALGRIESGTYGVCSSCGRPIDGSRLLAAPSTTVCVKCTT